MVNTRATALLLAVVPIAFALPQRNWGGRPGAQTTAAAAAQTSVAAAAAATTAAPTSTPAAAATSSPAAAATASVAPHRGNSAPAVNPNPDPTVAKATGSTAVASSAAATSAASTGASTTSGSDSGSSSSSSGSQKCISFTSDDDSWTYANTGNWGTKTGTFGSTNQICVPKNDDAGGAMYIGTQANPGAGNTKLECFFPSSGSGNCDVSLVDGYSLSVTCKAGGQTIGGSTNLWNTGKTCADTSLESQGICKNAMGYSAAQSDVSPFFQEAITGGNQYCVWVNCSQDYFFEMSSDVTCHVSGGKS